jgi:hypothetical protein
MKGGEPYRLRVGSTIPIHLITTKNHEIRLLLVEHLRHEIERSGVRLARSPIVAIRDRISTSAHAGAEVQVGDLHDLESPIVWDSGPRLLGLTRSTPAHAEMDAVLRRIEQQRRACDGPAVAWLGRVVAKEDVDVGNGVVGIAGLLVGRPLNPQSRGSSFPLLARVGLGPRIQSSHRHIHDNAIFICQVLLALATDEQVGFGGPCLAEVHVLVDAVPYFGIELAGAEDVDRGAFAYCDVCDDEPWMVSGHVIMERVR